jgi:hypothetical protein
MPGTTVLLSYQFYIICIRNDGIITYVVAKQRNSGMHRSPAPEDGRVTLYESSESRQMALMMEAGSTSEASVSF